MPLFPIIVSCISKLPWEEAKYFFPQKIRRTCYGRLAKKQPTAWKKADGLGCWHKRWQVGWGSSGRFSAEREKKRLPCWVCSSHQGVKSKSNNGGTGWTVVIASKCYLNIPANLGLIAPTFFSLDEEMCIKTNYVSYITQCVIQQNVLFGLQTYSNLSALSASKALRGNHVQNTHTGAHPGLNLLLISCGCYLLISVQNHSSEDKWSTTTLLCISAFGASWDESLLSSPDPKLTKASTVAALQCHINQSVLQKIIKRILLHIKTI